jgi:glycosyltransferase involved in cell wall biosynthesis
VGSPAAAGGQALRIVHVTNYQVPGYGYEEIQLGREQARLGHQVHIVTSNYLHPAGVYSVLSRRFPDRLVEPRRELVDGVHIWRMASAEISRRAWIHGLERQLRRLDPDVVHCHNVLQFHPARIAIQRRAGRLRGALVVDDHMHLDFMRRSPAGLAFYFVYRNLLQRVIEPCVDRYAAIADDTSDYMRRECGVRGPIAVVPLGAASEDFAPDVARRDAARARLGYRLGETVVLYAGKVIEVKGVHLLVAAARRLADGGEQVRVLAVGDSDEGYARTLQAAAGPGLLRLEPTVGHDLLPEFFAAADIAVWPRQESMSAFEAMAAGLPVVISARSGLTTTAAGEFGITYAPETADALEASLKALVRDPAHRALVGARGREYVAGRLSWRHSAERYLEIYREAITARDRS